MADAEIPIDIDNLVDKYVQLRDKRDYLKRTQQEALAPFNEVMGVIETKLLEHMIGTGASNIKTPHGTAYQAEFVSVKVGDWEATLAFILNNKLWHMLEKRVSKQAVDEFVTETGHLPPGIDIRKSKTVNIRRS